MALIKGTLEVPFIFEPATMHQKLGFFQCHLFLVKPTCVTANRLPTSLIQDRHP